MSKMTRKQVQALESVLYHLQRAQKYIGRADIAVCLKRDRASTTLDYIRPSDGTALVDLAKDIGSDLCGLEFAEKGLRQILEVQP